MKEMIVGLSGLSFGYLVREITNAEFISYSSLASLSGITVGTLTNENSGWLLFIYNNKILIVAKKNIRTNISWDQLNAAGCVFGTKQITIHSKQYKVRLLKGADSNPVPNYGTSGQQNYYLDGTHNSEWSKLFYPICRDDSHVPIPPAIVNAPYTMADLGMSTGLDYSWVQETTGNQPTWRMNRGNLGPSAAYHFISSHNTSNIDNWRPCLELI